MTRNFITLTQADIDLIMAETIKSAERELLSYDYEKAHHESVIADLKDLSWDDQTLKYKGLSRDEVITRAQQDNLDSAAIQKALDLNALDCARLNLEAVIDETAKVERIYATRLESLPAGIRRDDAFAALAEKEAAPAVT